MNLFFKGQFAWARRGHIQDQLKSRHKQQWVVGTFMRLCWYKPSMGSDDHFIKLLSSDKAWIKDQGEGTIEKYCILKTKEYIVFVWTPVMIKTWSEKKTKWILGLSYSQIIHHIGLLKLVIPDIRSGATKMGIGNNRSKIGQIFTPNHTWRRFADDRIAAFQMCTRCDYVSTP